LASEQLQLLKNLLLSHSRASILRYGRTKVYTQDPPKSTEASRYRLPAVAFHHILTSLSSRHPFRTLTRPGGLPALALHLPHLLALLREAINQPDLPALPLHLFLTFFLERLP
jgi:hypothetical protein